MVGSPIAPGKLGDLYGPNGTNGCMMCDSTGLPFMTSNSTSKCKMDH